MPFVFFVFYDFKSILFEFRIFIKLSITIIYCKNFTTFRNGYRVKGRELKCGDVLRMRAIWKLSRNANNGIPIGRIYIVRRQAVAGLFIK